MRSIKAFIRCSKPKQSSLSEQFLHIIQETFYSSRTEYFFSNKKPAPPKTRYIDVSIQVEKDISTTRIINDVNPQALEIYISHIFHDMFFSNQLEIASKGLSPELFKEVTVYIRCLYSDQQYKKLTERQKVNIYNLVENGKSKISVARMYSISIQAVTKACNKIKKCDVD